MRYAISVPNFGDFDVERFDDSLGDDLEPDARTFTVRILDAVRATAELVLGHPDRPVKRPTIEAAGGDAIFVVQRLGPDVRERFG